MNRLSNMAKLDKKRNKNRISCGFIFLDPTPKVGFSSKTSQISRLIRAFHYSQPPAFHYIPKRTPKRYRPL